MRIAFDEGGITGANCSCPYDWGGWCKHIVAVLPAHLRGASGYACARARVDVFLHEGRMDDAVAAVEKDTRYDLIEQVMDAVRAYRPEWVIEAARRQAERIIKAGRAKYYHHAVNCLTRVHLACQAVGREAGRWM